MHAARTYGGGKRSQGRVSSTPFDMGIRIGTLYGKADHLTLRLTLYPRIFLYYTRILYKYTFILYIRLMSIYSETSFP